MPKNGAKNVKGVSLGNWNQKKTIYHAFIYGKKNKFSRRLLLNALSFPKLMVCVYPSITTYYFFSLIPVSFEEEMTNLTEKLAFLVRFSVSYRCILAAVRIHWLKESLTNYSLSYINELVRY